MESAVYVEREERKYEVGIGEEQLPALRRDVSRYLPLCEFTPGQQITSVSSIYFDNKDYDLLRFSVLTAQHTLHARLRTYEYENSRLPQTLYYWMEVKLKRERVRRKKRFRMKREALLDILPGKDVTETVLDHNDELADPETIRSLFWETQDTFLNLGLKPILLVTYKRLAFQNGSERLCLDWDIQYYHVGTNGYLDPSLKEISERPAGKGNHVILELKYPQGAFPDWIGDLQRRYPIWEKTYSKFVEGMGFLFQGPLKHQREADSFLQMIKAYTVDSKAPLERDG